MVEKVATSKDLKLDYPCQWGYKAVLESHHNIKEIVKSVLNNKEYSIKKSNSSKTGKYQSHTILVLVQSDEDRKAIFKELKNHKSIKFVL